MDLGNITMFNNKFMKHCKKLYFNLLISTACFSRPTSTPTKAWGIGLRVKTDAGAG